MPLASLSDFNRAFDEGRWHSQRFVKNAGTAYALQWADPTFASGQPPYDARVGVPLAFTPSVASRNDAIYFPDTGAGEERRLVEATFWSNQATFNGPGSIVLFDLLGFYPLIDGDSTDQQDMDNTASLPRYADGDGVCMVMVNHVSAALQTGEAVIGYVDSAGAAQTTTMGVPNNGLNLVCSGMRPGLNLDVGNYAVSLASGSRGVRQVTSIRYTTPPSGLHAIYLVKPLATILTGDNQVAVEKIFIQHSGLHAPRILDGAWLGWFSRIGSGTARAVNWYGQFTFAWG